MEFTTADESFYLAIFRRKNCRSWLPKTINKNDRKTLEDVCDKLVPFEKEQVHRKKRDYAKKGKNESSILF